MVMIDSSASFDANHFELVSRFWPSASSSPMETMAACMDQRNIVEYPIILGNKHMRALRMYDCPRLCERSISLRSEPRFRIADQMNGKTVCHPLYADRPACHENTW